MSLLTAERPVISPVAAGRGGPTRWAPERVAALAVSCVIVLYTFLQAPGRIVADTKLDLYVAPGEFLRRALHLWDSQAAFGQVQNQAAGYLFPMGPFFALTHALHVPAWIAQRMWMSAILLLAFWGVLKLAGALRVGTPWTRLVGAAAYALSPAMLSLIAATSWTQLPAALLPWVMLPLVRHDPSHRPSRTAARSALIVAAMGGVNAMAVAAVLVMPLVWILTRPPGRIRRGLLMWWVACVALATLWWTAPLLLQGRYGFRFLDFTESAAVTTATSSVVEAVRGTGYWVSYLHVNGPWLQGAWNLVASPLVILASAFLAAAGLYALARKDMVERRFLALTAVVGVLIITAGYAGPLSSQLAPGIQSLLKGPLSPARNLNKFEPILRLALAIALAHALVVLDVSSLVRRVGSAALLVLIAAAPMWQGHLAPVGAFSGLPSYWRQAAGWLGDRAPKGRTLIVPSAAFGEYTWGRPLDEPMQALAKSDWAVRDIVPLGSVGETRLLDAVERPLERGEPSPGLAAFLARAGVHYVLLRNDLDAGRSGAPAPAYMRRALDGSPGFVHTRSFGPRVSYIMNTDRLTPDLGRSVRDDVHSLEVYELHSQPTTIATYPVAGAVSVSGAPDSLLQLSDAGALGDRATVLTGDPLAGKVGAGVHVQSDAIQRRDDQIGWVRNNLSFPLTPTERAPGTDQQPVQRLVTEGRGAEAAVRMTGAVSVTSSSYDNSLSRSPERQPYAAFDGDPATAWVTGSPKGPVGEWLKVQVAKPISPRTIDVRLLLERPLRPQITALRITTAAGSVTRRLRDTEGPQALTLPRGKTTWIRLTIASVRQGGGGAGLREVHVPGVGVERTLALPKPPTPPTPSAGASQEVLLTRAHADPYDRTHEDEERGLDRIFSVPAATEFGLSGTVTPVPGDELDNLVDALAPESSLRVVPSSVWAGIPAFGAHSLVDGDIATTWLASPDDRHPSVTLSWEDTRTLDSIQVRAPDGPAVRPLKLRLQSGLAVRDVDVSSGDVVPFEPVHGDRVTVTLVDSTPTAVGAKTPGFVNQLPFGMAELRFPALDDLSTAGPTGDVRLPCGQGPTVAIDGTAVPTAVEGTASDIEAVSPLRFTACGDPLRLAAGEHRLSASAQGGLVLTTAALSTAPAQPAGPARPAAIAGTWGVESRQIRVGAGPSSYLALTENFNKGWTATLHGHVLKAVRLDGWRQAWIVPAGAGGLVHLSFPAGHVYIWLIAAGVAALVVVLELAFWPSRRRRLVSHGDDVLFRPSLRLPSAVPWAGVLAVGFLLAGVLGALAGAALLLLPIGRSRLPALAGCAFALAGISVFLSPGRFPGSGSGAFGALTQLFAMVAVIAVAASLVRARGEP